MALTWDVLKLENDKTTTAVIELLKADPAFIKFAQAEGDGISKRDEEDGSALEAGINMAKAKGVLPSDMVPTPYQEIDVLGKTGTEVAQEIISKVGEAATKGCVIVLVGLSGTGKGTTVAQMMQMLPNSTAWSNGNCFRGLTLLAVKFCESQGKDFDPEVLTAENLKSWSEMLTFGKFGDKYDIKISGNGVDATVSAIANTDLKAPSIGKNIPTVAKQTQGEVVKFAANAVTQMGAEGSVVLLEGREQTLDFIPSPYRFRLVLSQPELIGQRRAAQRLASGALKQLSEGASADDITKALSEQLAQLA